MALRLHINPILLRDTSLVRRSFLLTTRLLDLAFQLGDLGLLACDLGVVVRPFVRVPDALRRRSSSALAFWYSMNARRSVRTVSSLGVISSASSG